MTLALTLMTLTVNNPATHAAQFVMLQNQKIRMMSYGYSVTISNVPLGTMYNVPTLIFKTPRIWTQPLGCALNITFDNNCQFISVSINLLYYIIHFFLNILYPSTCHMCSVFQLYITKKKFVTTLEHVAIVSGNGRHHPPSISRTGRIIRVRAAHTKMVGAALRDSIGR